MTEGKRDDLEDTPPVIGSGNFLADQGYAEPDETRVKFRLANEIALLIERHGLLQSEVCEMTGLRQPDVSKIANGNVAGFSVWRLLQVLKGLGQKVTISVETPDEDASPVALSL